jgi:quercetin dioxygenase-like cupin family protein
MKLRTLAFSFLILNLCTALNAEVITPILPNSTLLEWTDSQSLPGAKIAMLKGDPSKKEFFIARIKLPADFIVPIHCHPVNEYDTVISGTLYFGTGDKINIQEIIPLPTGSFVTIPAKTPHFAITKNETILQVSGIGPWGMLYKR